LERLQHIYYIYNTSALFKLVKRDDSCFRKVFKNAYVIVEFQISFSSNGVGWNQMRHCCHLRPDENLESIQFHFYVFVTVLIPIIWYKWFLNLKEVHFISSHYKSHIGNQGAGGNKTIMAIFENFIKLILTASRVSKTSYCVYISSLTIIEIFKQLNSEKRYLICKT